MQMGLIDCLNDSILQPCHLQLLKTLNQFTLKFRANIFGVNFIALNFACVDAFKYVNGAQRLHE